MLPNLIVIGAAKCGTTSLHEYLDDHPEISMSHEKELHFFVDRKNWDRGLAWYEAQFDASAPVRGESSPGYSAYPLYRGVAERMARTIPHARLVYLVEALGDPHVREWLVTPSRYWLQLEQYLEHFPAEQILVVDSDELRASLPRIFELVGVDPSFESAGFERAHNAGTGRTRRNRAGQAVSAALERTLGPTRSQALRERAPQALKSPFRYEVEPAALREELRTELEDELRDDAERLRAHTGLAFAGWPV